MTLFNVVTTEQEAIEGTAHDNELFLASIPDSESEYRQQTTCWANYRQRLDGKFVWPVYHGSDRTYATEEKTEFWFNINE